MRVLMIEERIETNKKMSHMSQCQMLCFNFHQGEHIVLTFEDSSQNIQQIMTGSGVIVGAVHV